MTNKYEITANEMKKIIIISTILLGIFTFLLAYFSEDIRYFYYSHQFLNDTTFVKTGEIALKDTPLVVNDGRECSKFKLVGNEMLTYYLSDGSISCGCVGTKILFGTDRSGQVSYFCAPHNRIIDLK